MKWIVVWRASSAGTMVTCCVHTVFISVSIVHPYSLKSKKYDFKRYLNWVRLCIPQRCIAVYYVYVRSHTDAAYAVSHGFPNRTENINRNGEKIIIAWRHRKCRVWMFVWNTQYFSYCYAGKQTGITFVLLNGMSNVPLISSFRMCFGVLFHF